MSINLGTTEVELSLYSKALQLATFTVEVPVVGELEPDSVFIGDDMHATVMPPPDGSVEKAVRAGVEAFQKAFNESMESRGM